MPTSGAALTSVSISATLHCLTGCALGEVAGVAIGTALGFSNGATIALAIGLAFLFGYSLTSLPLLRAGLALGAVIPIALASDTLSIATMEVVDNLILVVIPGAMDAGLADLLFWGSLAFALVIAGAFAVPVNRWLIARGKGHAVVHETGIHGGPPVKVVAWAAATAFVFGSAVLVAEALNGDEMGTHGGEMTADAEGHAADPVRGLSVAEDGMRLEMGTSTGRAGIPTTLEYRVVDERGEAVRDFEIEHTKPMHLIVVRRDLTGFQHLHPTMRADGTWTTELSLPESGSYRVFADFAHDGENRTLAGELNVDGPVDWRALPAQADTARTDDGYEVRLAWGGSSAGDDRQLAFTVTRDGAPVDLQEYLGAGAHLVALRESDLAFLHVHPMESGPAEAAGSGKIRFMTEFPSAGGYRLFLQFKHDGRVHTAAFTREVSDASS
ncbi:MAG TPA: DUF4396 domain-containing protein [Solirubrobacterales bacterium]|nr:DUF4396 domain-containing protein [Solirubrobacterales bacterium]